MKGLSCIGFELRQAEDEGRAVPEELAARAKALEGRPVTDAQAVAEADEIYAQVQKLPLRAEYPYREPDALEEIQAERPAPVPLPECTLTREELYNRIYGGWLGRCGGCLLLLLRGLHAAEEVVDAGLEGEDLKDARLHQLRIHRVVKGEIGVGEGGLRLLQRLHDLLLFRGGIAPLVNR